jgi:hypothetical protein
MCCRLTKKSYTPAGRVMNPANHTQTLYIDCHATQVHAPCHARIKACTRFLMIRQASALRGATDR